jgi:hypothetical protein
MTVPRDSYGAPPLGYLYCAGITAREKWKKNLEKRPVKKTGKRTLLHLPLLIGQATEFEPK